MMVVGPDHQIEPTRQNRDRCVEQRYLLILESKNFFRRIPIIFRRWIQKCRSSQNFFKPCFSWLLAKPVKHQSVGFQKCWIRDDQFALFAGEAFQFALCAPMILVVTHGPQRRIAAQCPLSRRGSSRRQVAVVCLADVTLTAAFACRRDS